MDKDRMKGSATNMGGKAKDEKGGVILDQGAEEIWSTAAVACCRHAAGKTWATPELVLDLTGLAICPQDL